MIFFFCNFIYFYQKNSNRVDNVYFVFKFVNVNLKRCLRFRMDSGYHFNISRYFTSNYIIFKIYCSNLTSMLIFFINHKSSPLLLWIFSPYCHRSKFCVILKSPVCTRTKFFFLAVKQRISDFLTRLLIIYLSCKYCGQ